MALKREIELKLGDAGLIEFFEANRESWVALTQKMFDLVATLYPAGLISKCVTAGQVPTTEYPAFMTACKNVAHPVELIPSCEISLCLNA